MYIYCIPSCIPEYFFYIKIWLSVGKHSSVPTSISFSSTYRQTGKLLKEFSNQSYVQIKFSEITMGLIMIFGRICSCLINQVFSIFKSELNKIFLFNCPIVG
ncbi:MAG: hypothetical protein CBB99_02330 [Bacteroidetes bacterium TMED39]|nr:MAG: hypothetical protein CBB99_02330 [Bacteroidetes bacterium TMED39]